MAFVWTEEALDALAADIAADPGLATLPHNSDGAWAVAQAYNLPAVPDFWVWRTMLAPKEIYETTTSDGTTWSWTLYINRSPAEQNAWRELTATTGYINAALANTRQGIADIFSGAQGTPQRTHLITLARRRASRTEKLFATGQGTTASPATMTFEGPLSPSLVEQAWAE